MIPYTFKTPQNLEIYLCCLSLSVYVQGLRSLPSGDCGEEAFCFHACEVLTDFISEAVRALKETLGMQPHEFRFHIAFVLSIQGKDLSQFKFFIKEISVAFPA